MVNKTNFETINIDDFNHDPINQEKVQSYPPELVGRFNSFIVTAFDDSMTVEMQIRTMIKWVKENIDVTMSALDNMEAFKQDSMLFQNHVKDTLVNLINQFTDAFDDNLQFEMQEILKQWDEDGYLQSLINEYTNERMDALVTDKISRGTVEYEDFTQNLKELLSKASETGFPVLDKESVFWTHISSPLKKILDGIARNRIYFKFILGGIDADNPTVKNENKDPSKGILENIYIELEQGDSIILDDPTETYQMSVVPHDLLNYIGGWTIKSYTALKNERVSIQIKRADDEPADFDHMASCFYQLKPLETTLIRDNAITIKKLNKEVDSHIRDVSQGYEEIGSFVSGTLDVSKSPIEHIVNEAYTRAILGTLKPIKLKDGDKIILIATNKYDIAFGIEGVNYFPNGWNTTEYTAVGQQDVCVMVKMKESYKTETDNIDGILDLKDVEESIRIKRNIFGSILSKYGTRYVSLNGDDSNDGKTISTAYATLNKALEDKPERVLIEKGTYYNIEPVIDSSIDNIVISSYGGEIDEKAVFVGGEFLTFNQNGNVYSSKYSGNEFYNAVFVTKTKPTMTSGTRPSPNAVLWEIYKDVEQSYKMKPVLTLAEVEAEKGTFFYNGTDIIINPYHVNNRFLVSSSKNGLTLSGKNVELIDLEFTGFHNSSYLLNNIENLIVTRCNANYSGQYNGFNINYTNAIFNDCIAIKNRNDGFNIHHKGHTVFNNCHGLYNYDDGISHHEICTGFINGGTWIGNGKGGISPVNNCDVTIQNAVLIDNGFASFNDIDTKTQYSNCLFENNTNGIRNTGTGQVMLINCIEVNNGEDIIASSNSIKRY